jgi:TPR repeat protein
MSPSFIGCTTKPDLHHLDPVKRPLPLPYKEGTSNSLFARQHGPWIQTVRESNSEMGRLQLRSSILEPRARGDGVENRLLQAAERGDARAQCNLGILYSNALDDNGHPVEGNRPQAVKWLLAAAEQGLARAQLKLAEIEADAPDISGSHTAACGWFLLAAMGLRGIHLHRARSGYARIAAHLTLAQIAEARRFARDRAPQRREAAADLPSQPLD